MSDDDVRVRNQTYLGLLPVALMNMSPIPKCPELRLLSWVVASVIYDDLMSAHQANVAPLRQSFFHRGGNFYPYCRLMGLDGDQVKKMALDSWQKVMVTTR